MLPPAPAQLFAPSTPAQIAQLQNINFYENYNHKLSLDYFTTIRAANKYQIGDYYKIMCNRQYCFIAKVEDIKAFWLHELPDITAKLDTGFNKDETANILRAMYKDFDFTKNKIYLVGLRKI